MQGPVILMLGAPTASGKSSVAIRLARGSTRPVEIVTADAMQVYTGMDIGTAKPTPAERAGVTHHMIDLVTPAESWSVAQWVGAAEAVIHDCLARGVTPLVVGGTGFYLRALAEGLPLVPTADPDAQKPLWDAYREQGLEPLLAELEAGAPRDAVRAERNPRRVIRALEILRTTGRPPSSFGRSQPAHQYSKVVLLPGKDVLRPRIVQRAQEMFGRGLVGEVAALLSRWPRQSTALQGIGYKEVVAHLQGETSLSKTQRSVIRATVSYAGRQLTWFRREPAASSLPGLAFEHERELALWLD